MAMVNTVNGPIDSAQLGFTLMHEHIVSLDHGLRDVWPELFDREAIVRQAGGAVGAARAAGVDTIVDLSTIDMGRDVRLVAEAIAQSGMQAIVATGAWLRPPRYFSSRSPDVPAALFVKDIEQGIQDTGVKAGIIKVACNDAQLGGVFDTTFRAAARAQRRTGVPISTHTNALVRSGLDQQRVFLEEGVDLTRTIIGHSADTPDLDYLKQLLDRGSYLGMDRFGMEHFEGQQLLDNQRRVQVIAELCRQGYANQIVLSHDASGYSDARSAEFTAQHWPNWRYTYVPQTVVPALLEAGVTAAQIELLTRGNPRAIFERSGGY